MGELKTKRVYNGWEQQNCTEYVCASPVTESSGLPYSFAQPHIFVCTVISNCCNFMNPTFFQVKYGYAEEYGTQPGTMQNTEFHFSVSFKSFNSFFLR